MKEKIIALVLTAIMAATYFGIVSAADNLGTYPAPFCSGGVCNFYAVVGSTAQAMDVVGSGDVLARLAGENYVETSTTGGTSTSVTGEGARLDTSSNRILLGENLQNGGRTAITSTDLPTLLKKGEVTDDNGNTYGYTQDFTIDDAATVTFGTSGGDYKDPILYINLPSSSVSSANYIYSTRVTFSKALNITSDSVVDNTINLFGTEYTIGTGSSYTTATKKLILYGGANTVVLKDGEEQKVTVGGIEYTVKNEGASDATHAVISVDGVTKSVTKASTYKISGLDVYVSDVYYYVKESAVSSVKLSLGSEKLTLEDGGEVLFGASDTVDNTRVALTGTASDGTISKLEVFIAAQDSEKDDVQIGQSYTDPVWKTFKLNFASTSPALDDSNSDSIVVGTTGDKGVNIKFKDYATNDVSVDFTYNNQTITSAPTLSDGLFLMDSDSYKISIREAENVLYKHYLLVNQGDETHLLQLTNVPYGVIKSTDLLKFKDVVTGTIYEKEIGSTCATTYCNVSMTIGSQTYFVKVFNNSDSKTNSYVQVTWDDANAIADSGATYGVAGNYTLFPGLKAKNGEYIYFVNNYTTVPCGSQVIVPTTGNTASRITINCPTSGIVITATTGGKFSYNYFNSSTTAYIQMTSLNTSRTGIAILEEKQSDGSTQDVWYVPIVTTTSGSNYQVKVNTPTFSTSTSTVPSGNSFITLSSSGNTYIQKLYDVYGALVTYDSYQQGKATITYPNEQVYTNIFLLTSGATTSSTATGGGTVKKVVPIGESVAKLDTDISDPATVTKHLVLIGGSCANPLVQKLVDSGKIDAKFTCTGGIPGAGWETGKGYIFYVSNAFGNATGYSAVVIAGTDAIDTRNACSVMQKFDNIEIAAKLKDQTKVAVTAVSGAGITPLA